MKRVYAMLLAVILMLSIVPISVMAAGRNVSDNLKLTVTKLAVDDGDSVKFNFSVTAVDEIKQGDYINLTYNAEDNGKAYGVMPSDYEGEHQLKNSDGVLLGTLSANKGSVRLVFASNLAAGTSFKQDIYIDVMAGSDDVLHSMLGEKLSTFDIKYGKKVLSLTVRPTGIGGNVSGDRVSSVTLYDNKSGKAISTSKVIRDMYYFDSVTLMKYAQDSDVDLSQSDSLRINNSVFGYGGNLVTKNFVLFASAPKYIRYGDVNMDGKIDESDANFIQKAIVSKEVKLTAMQKEIADVDGDGEVLVADSIYIYKYIRGYADESFRTGKITQILNGCRYLYGDMNRNGVYDKSDIDLLESLIDTENYTAELRELADVNGDGNIDANDASIIRAFIANETGEVNRIGISSSVYKVVEEFVEPTVPTTVIPTTEPTEEPTTEMPTTVPVPTVMPTTVEPTTVVPTTKYIEPTEVITVKPTVRPTEIVPTTVKPTAAPTTLPTVKPTIKPTVKPTQVVTTVPATTIRVTESTVQPTSIAVTTVAPTEMTTSIPVTTTVATESTTESTTQMASTSAYTKPFVTEPTTNVATNDTATQDTVKPSVQTGGGVNVVVWIVMAICALLSFVVLTIAIKKNNKD